MPRFELEIEGKRFEAEGPSMEAVLAAIGPQPQQQPQVPSASLGGALNLGSAMLTGAVAEPAAGIAGLGQLAAGGGAEQAAGTVEDIRGRFTSDLSPEGAATLQAGISAVEQNRQASTEQQFGQPDENLELPEALSRAKLTEFLNVDLAEEAFKRGGPAAGAFVKTLPTLAIEAIGMKGARTANKLSQASRQSVTKALSEAAPDVKGLRKARDAAAREIKRSGGTVKPGAAKSLVKRLTNLKDEAVDLGKGSATPGAARAIRRVRKSAEDGTLDLRELMGARNNAASAAKGIPSSTTTAAGQVRDVLDDFIDKVGPQRLSGASKDTRGNLTTMKSLHRRIANSETISEIVEQAANSQTGTAQSLQTRLDALLRSKKARFFTDADKKLIGDVAKAKGAPAEKLARMLGKFALVEHGQLRVVNPAVGGLAAFEAAGLPGLAILGVTGQISRGLANRLAAKNGRGLARLVLAGSDGRRITAAYQLATPASQRSAGELASLLAKGTVNLSNLPSTPLAQQAGQLARQLRGAALLAPGAEQSTVGAPN